jgi:transposase-like protein
MREKYSAELKLAAIWLVHERGLSVAAVAQILGPHRSTVARWVADADQEIWPLAAGTPAAQSSGEAGQGRAGPGWDDRLEKLESFAVPVIALLAGSVALVALWLGGSL